ncbi:MAG: FAD binding domain-containing protein [Nakamurella sp.]
MSELASTTGVLLCARTAAEVDALLADAGTAACGAAGTDPAAGAQAADAALIAGGTDLLVQRRAGRRIDTMVDLTNLTDSPQVLDELPGGVLRLSAVAPIAAVATVLGDRLPALRAAIAVFASPQIRNRATIGGNLGTASPSGDLMPPLIAAGATVRVRGAGRREVPIGEFLIGPRRTGLQAGEWIEAVDVVDAGGAQGFRKIGGRRALAISVVNLAWQWTIRPDGTLADVRLAVGAAAPTVRRCCRAEATLEGGRPSRELADRAAADLAAELAPIDDLRGSAAYRRAAAGGLLTEALLAAEPLAVLNDESPTTPGKDHE